MKQMITRIDDELHTRLKARAEAEGRSVNDLVTSVLAAAMEESATPEAVRARARASGRLVVPPRPRTAVNREELLAASRGVGRAVSEALEAERAGR